MRGRGTGWDAGIRAEIAGKGTQEKTDFFDNVLSYNNGLITTRLGFTGFIKRKGIMHKLRLGFVMLFLLQLGVSAPASSVEPKSSSSTSKGSKAKTALSSVSTPQALGDQIAKFFGSKTGKDLMAEKAGNVSGAGAAATKAMIGKSAVKTATATPLKPGYVPPPPTPRVSVPQIRQEIQQIFELNKKIKNVQSGRSVQLQRVQEQARIHQKILNELEVTQKQAAGQKASEKNTLLAQEKLRIIHEETQRNAQAIEDLKEIPAGTVTKAVEKVKTVAS
jgi:hypothetical protein